MMRGTMLVPKTSKKLRVTSPPERPLRFQISQKDRNTSRSHWDNMHRAVTTLRSSWNHQMIKKESSFLVIKIFFVSICCAESGLLTCSRPTCIQTGESSETQHLMHFDMFLSVLEISDSVYWTKWKWSILKGSWRDLNVLFIQFPHTEELHQQCANQAVIVQLCGAEKVNRQTELLSSFCHCSCVTEQQLQHCECPPCI